MNSSSYVATRAKWMIWCVESKDNFTMYGSRKVNQLDLEGNYGPYWNELDIFSPSASGCVSLPTSYSLTGALAGFTMVVAKTEFEAFITLMHTFQEEERMEKEEAKAIAGRIKENKKREKAHLKAKKQAKEGKFDAVKCPETCFYCIEENQAYGVDCDCDPDYEDHCFYCGDGDFFG